MCTAQVRRRFERRILVPLPEAEVCPLLLCILPCTCAAQSSCDDTGASPYCDTKATAGARPNTVESMGRACTQARATLLRLHLGATPHALGAEEVRRLAERMQGFSGADISVLVRDALMEPVRVLQAATHFRQQADGAWLMCEPHERGAVQMRLMQVPSQQLRTPHVTLAHLERAMLATRPSVGPEDLHRFEEFTRLYGAGN